MKLRKPCEHDRYEPHNWQKPDGDYAACPGGEFLPEGALVIEPGSLERRWWCKASRALREGPGICISSPSFHPDCCWVSIIEKPRDANRCFNCRGVGLVSTFVSIDNQTGERRGTRNVICSLCQGTGLISENEMVRFLASQVGESE